MQKVYRVELDRKNENVAEGEARYKSFLTPADGFDHAASKALAAVVGEGWNVTSLYIEGDFLP